MQGGGGRALARCNFSRIWMRTKAQSGPAAHQTLIHYYLLVVIITRRFIYYSRIQFVFVVIIIFFTWWCYYVVLLLLPLFNFIYLLYFKLLFLCLLFVCVYVSTPPHPVHKKNDREQRRTKRELDSTKRFSSGHSTYYHLNLR